MCDGKTIKIVSNIKSTKTCQIDGLNPTQYTDYHDVREGLPINEEAFDMGLTTLHAWLRSYELVLDIGEKGAPNTERLSALNKSQIPFKAKYIHDAMKDLLGISVNEARAGGMGNSNSGNNARNAFKNFEVFSDITKVDERITHRLWVILTTINLPYEINPDAFELYCSETERLFKELYPWRLFTLSLHRVLHHGPEFVRRFPLPIGCYTEQSGESRNKILRFDR